MDTSSSTSGSSSTRRTNLVIDSSGNLVLAEQALEGSQINDDGDVLPVPLAPETQELTSIEPAVPVPPHPGQSNKTPSLTSRVTERKLEAHAPHLGERSFPNVPQDNSGRSSLPKLSATVKARQPSTTHRHSKRRYQRAIRRDAPEVVYAVHSPFQLPYKATISSTPDGHTFDDISIAETRAGSEVGSPYNSDEDLEGNASNSSGSQTPHVPDQVRMPTPHSPQPSNSPPSIAQSNLTHRTAPPGSEEGHHPALAKPVPLMYFAGLVLQDMPKQVYLHFLLRLPALYFSRVSRVFEEAALSLPEIKKMALKSVGEGKFSRFPFMYGYHTHATHQLKITWESFIDSIVREWETFNIVSVLLLSAILTTLQIEPAASDPLIRYTALVSLICALISLIFGCMYIIRFGTMRKSYKAAEWALEATKDRVGLLWNIWVFLAMPAVWLAWSLILYIVCIMSFVWRTSTPATSPPPPLSDDIVLIVRIIISTVLAIGVLYGCFVVRTLRRYGDAMDKAWERRFNGWISNLPTSRNPRYFGRYPYPTRRTSYSPSRYRNRSIRRRRNPRSPGEANSSHSWVSDAPSS